MIVVVTDDVVGSVHRQPAEFGPQSTVGRCGWLSARLRSYADEIVSGELKSLRGASVDWSSETLTM